MGAGQFGGSEGAVDTGPHAGTYTGIDGAFEGLRPFEVCPLYSDEFLLNQQQQVGINGPDPVLEKLIVEVGLKSGSHQPVQR